MQASTRFPVTPIHGWSLLVPCCLIVGTAVGSFAPNTIASLVGVTPIFIESAAALLFLTVVIAMTFAGRCYRCNQNLLFRSMSKETASSWLTRFIEMKACPLCGYPKDTNE
jgi:hypothetical protein